MRKVNLAIAAGSIALLAAGASAWHAPRDPIGGCAFNPDTMRFTGTLAEQAGCLLRKVRPEGGGADAQPIPAALLDRIGKPLTVPLPALGAYLMRQGIDPRSVGANGAAGDAPDRVYFVIHDTSFPEIPKAQGFPADLNDATWSYNTVKPTQWATARKQVNAVTTRNGGSEMFQDWAAARPMSGVKIETQAHVPAAKKVFIHVENIQPRLKTPTKWAWEAPVPGFAPKQVKRLALLYVVASIRAGHWLVPAFHFNIDRGLPDGHDDPQNFDLPGWAAEVAAAEQQIRASMPAAMAAPSWPAWIDFSAGVDVDEPYRAEFLLCDQAGMFRGYQLPKKVGGVAYSPCFNDANAVTVLRRLPPGAGGQTAILFTSKLALDLDGSWYACNRPGHTDQCPTTYQPRDAAGVKRPVNSDFIPYIVIPVKGVTAGLGAQFGVRTGVAMGDFGVVIKGDLVVPVIVADGGPFNKLGEGSIALHRALNNERCATKRPDGSCLTMKPDVSLNPPIVTIIFPGSARADVTQANIGAVTAAEGTRRWNAVRARLGRP